MCSQTVFIEVENELWEMFSVDHDMCPYGRAILPMLLEQFIAIIVMGDMH